MNFSINPLIFQSMNLETVKDQKSFLYALSVILAQLVAAVNTTQGNLGLTPLLQYLGTITVDQIVNCNGAFFIYIAFASALTQTRTITIKGVPQGACVFFLASISANTLTFKVSGTDQNGNAIDATCQNPSTGVITDLTSTGIALSNSAYFWGQLGFFTTSTSPRLNLIVA